MMEVKQKSYEKLLKTSRVDLRTLQNFPNPAWGSGFINVFEEITNFKLIGKVLLKSPQGERVREIQVLHENGGRVAILRDIFQTWLMEDEEATWEKLVTHLISAGLSPLAQAIQSRFREY